MPLCFTFNIYRSGRELQILSEMIFFFSFDAGAKQKGVNVSESLSYD